jgi:hypothetical protein
MKSGLEQGSVLFEDKEKPIPNPRRKIIGSDSREILCEEGLVGLGWYCKITYSIMCNKLTY